MTRAASLEQIRCEWVAARAPALHASHLIYFYVFLMCDSEGWRRVTGVLDWGGADGRPRPEPRWSSARRRGRLLRRRLWHVPPPPPLPNTIMLLLSL